MRQTLLLYKENSPAVKAGTLADGLIGAVQDAGKILSAHFPKQADDRNELPDRVVEI